MSGIFSMWQPRYAERGVPTFPVDETKKPRIRSWQSVGLKGSAELANKFDDANALGYVTGRRSNVTVLDIDTTEENIAADAIQGHGQPAIITRTASGKFHHLYRYNGERRRIRPWSELPIDLLGDNGYALAAPSKTATGSYEIIHGHTTTWIVLPQWWALRQRRSCSHCHPTGPACERAMAATARSGNAA